MMIKFGPIGASQMALVVNNSLANKEDVRDTGLILGLGRSPGEGQGNPFLFFFFLSGESHGQRRLVGYSPWGCKESDTTKRLIHTHTHSVDEQFCACFRHTAK